MNFRKVLSFSLLALAALLPDAHSALSARHSHTTTLLPEGNILITGGVDDAANNRTTSVQMYNMKTNAFDTWGGGGPLDTPRSSHTATLMSDGRILIAGGFIGAGGSTPTNSLEVCDPIAKTCAAIAAVLSSPRAGHTATLLTKGNNSGKVLICGGQTADAAISITETCDLFNPADDTVGSAASMVSARMGHAAVLLKSGNVLVSGGRRWNTSVVPNAWLYEPMNEMYDVGFSSWTPKDALLQGRVDHSVTVLNNGLILIAGGFNNVNVKKCVNELGEECWTPEDYEAWQSSFDVHDMGSHGYLDGAELFDQNGGRMVLGESTFGTAPYRFHKHSAVLLPDGGWSSQGGYGGIVRTLFQATPALDKENTTVIKTNNTGPNTADIVPATTHIRFPLTLSLSRAVSGRLVNADAYFARPKEPTDPSLAFQNVKLFLNHSTAALDGFPVGTLIDSAHNPGDFDSIIELDDPIGTATFQPASVNSDGNANPDLTVSDFNLTFPAVYPTTSISPNSPQEITGGDITATIGMSLPKIYKGTIRGIATFRNGTITDPAKLYAIAINPPSAVAFTIPAETSCDATNCLFEASINMPNITGTISNLADKTTIQADSANLVAGGLLAISFQLDYTADTITPGDEQPTFNYQRSDIVVREMIFSSALGFTTNANSWKDLSNTDVSPTLGTPVFNHTSVLTPAADTLILGGRNCEPATPPADPTKAPPEAACARGTKTFTATGAYGGFIPVYKGSGGGSNSWIDSKKLNSKRAFHTSTLLLNGQILTCGGSDGVRPLATCELMDPETKAWTPTAPMNVARARHTATLLPNGNVLVAGGATPSSAAVSTAEIYYPSSRSWVLTTPMHDARNFHTATLLPDGNVLVAGGNTLSTVSATTDIFITSASYGQAGGSLAIPRAQHTATLLKDGNVLMAGGINGFGAIRDTEVFSYLTRAIIPAAAAVMNTGRYSHTANLLRDGRVLVIGGSNNDISQLTAEIYDAGAWTYTQDASATPVLLTYNRTSHRSVLLPNGKVMVTGGETAGTAQNRAEGFDPDFTLFSDQGGGQSRSHHTTVLTQDNYILNIGGWDGSKYLDSTDMAYFSFFPDAEGLEAETTRTPAISTGTVLFNWGDRVTLESGTTNFHGITEASGGGAGAMNSSQSNPRVYMQQIDNSSGFMIDLSTRIYSWYGGLYGGAAGADWETSLSSITLITPSLANEMPHGWYHMRVASNGQFSMGHTVQVTIPRPTGLISVPEAVVLGTSSINWSWDQGTITVADGYSLYSASSSIFITTMAFVSPANYTQTGLKPNSQTSIMVSAYNLGGYGPLQKSSTFYTFAAVPSSLTITSASFETVALTWDPQGNTPATPYEISMCSSLAGDCFNDPVAISTPVPFSVNHVSTSVALNQLSASQLYYFRVRARNGSGVETAFDTTVVSTITVAGVSNLTGTAISSSAISWSWNEVPGAGIYYEIYDVNLGTANKVFAGSTTYNYFTQNFLAPNSSHTVTVNAAKDNAGLGTVRGPLAFSGGVFTLTDVPTPGTPNVFTNVSTGSFRANWITNGNPDGTIYKLTISTHADFVEYSSFTTVSPSMDFLGLQPNERYYVTLNAINNSGAEGATVQLGSKYTLARAPLAMVPVATTMSGITLGWETADNSSTTIYEVRGTTENFNLSITTYVPFAALYTKNFVQLTGLLTATTYYFDVAARNGEGATTARIQAVPSTCTLAGPDNAPAGSVGGTSDPSLDTIISGTLPNGRRVSMAIPAGAFPTATAIAISSSTTNSCSYLVGGNPLEVSIYSQNGAQPQVPVSLTLYYDSAESNAAIDANRNRMVIARYNPVSGQCLPLETLIDTGPRSITATLNHFSVFQLIVRTASANLSNVLVYPNPYYTNRGNGFVTIANIPASAKVRIYTLSGEKVWEGTAGSTGILIWKGLNKSGELIASGIYLAVIDSSAGKKVVKLAVER